MRAGDKGREGADNGDEEQNPTRAKDQISSYSDPRSILMDKSL